MLLYDDFTIGHSTGYDTANVDWTYRFDRLRQHSERLKELGSHTSGARYRPDAAGFVYMRRNEQGERSLWRFDIGPGETPEPIANTEGVEHFDWVGDDLFVKRRNQRGFEWRQGRDFASVKQVFADLEPISASAWTIRGRHLFVVVRDQGRNVLKRGDLDSGTTITLAQPVDADAVGPSLAMSADGTSLWFARTASLHIDLMRLPVRGHDHESGSR